METTITTRQWVRQYSSTMLKKLVSLMGLFVLLCFCVAAMVIWMMIVQTPFHTSLPSHLPSSRTIRIGKLGTMDVATVPPPMPATEQSVGIVICAFHGTLSHAAACIHSLRHTLRCTLPIEVWYSSIGGFSGFSGYSGSTFSPQAQFALRNIQRDPLASCHDVSTLHNFRHMNLDGPQLRGIALFLSAFQHTVLLDATVICTLDPWQLIQSPQYDETGAMFFADPFRSHNTTANALWEQLGITKPRVPNTEWSCAPHLMVFDRRRHWLAMHAIYFLHMQHERVFLTAPKGVDLMWLGMEMVHDTGYTRAEHVPGVLRVNSSTTGIFTNVSLLHTYTPNADSTTEPAIVAIVDLNVSLLRQLHEWPTHLYAASKVEAMRPSYTTWQGGLRPLHSVVMKVYNWIFNHTCLEVTTRPYSVAIDIPDQMRSLLITYVDALETLQHI